MYKSDTGNIFTLLCESQPKELSEAAIYDTINIK